MDAERLLFGLVVDGWKYGRKSLCEHGLARTWWTYHEKSELPCCGDGARPLGKLLSYYVRVIKKRVHPMGGHRSVIVGIQTVRDAAVQMRQVHDSRRSDALQRNMTFTPPTDNDSVELSCEKLIGYLAFNRTDVSVQGELAYKQHIFEPI